VSYPIGYETYTASGYRDMVREANLIREFLALPRRPAYETWDEPTREHRKGFHSPWD
jgi:hypothetical protein